MIDLSHKGAVRYRLFMPHASWRDAVAALVVATRAVTPSQQQLARSAGADLPADLPSLVAAARLQAMLGGELGIGRAAACSAEQLEFLASLETEYVRAFSPPQDQRELGAWVSYLRFVRRRTALEALQIEAGDIVQVDDVRGRHIEEVASIGSDGRLFLKGGSGAGAWPDEVALRCRRHDSSNDANELRRQAANNAAHRVNITKWSDAKKQELAAFEVQAPLTEEDVNRLEEVIGTATDEKPIQNLIESRPQLLAALLRGKDRFCLSRVQLPGKYEADFLICDADSLGLRWVFVELETPKSTVTLVKDNQLDKHARKGVSQVQEWREWIQNNLALARQSRQDDGLGLVDIRPQSEGLVLVGRRRNLGNNARPVRNQIREKLTIHVHTYDWLVETLRGVLDFSGPPGVNPFTL